MCPACLTSIALAVATSTGVGAVMVRILRRTHQEKSRE